VDLCFRLKRTILAGHAKQYRGGGIGCGNLSRSLPEGGMGLWVARVRNNKMVTTPRQTKTEEDHKKFLEMLPRKEHLSRNLGSFNSRCSMSDSAYGGSLSECGSRVYSVWYENMARVDCTAWGETGNAWPQPWWAMKVGQRLDVSTGC